MKTTYTIFRPGKEPERAEVDMPESPGYKLLAALIDDLVEGHMEHVTVLYKGKRADMFVNETGALDSLPLNEAATTIYHAASQSRGESMAGAPVIHGVAVLFDRIVWM